MKKEVREQESGVRAENAEFSAPCMGSPGKRHNHESTMRFWQPTNLPAKWRGGPGAVWPGVNGNPWARAKSAVFTSVGTGQFGPVPKELFGMRSRTKAGFGSPLRRLSPGSRCLKECLHVKFARFASVLALILSVSACGRTIRLQRMTGRISWKHGRHQKVIAAKNCRSDSRVQPARCGQEFGLAIRETRVGPVSCSPRCDELW
jgi:hypothetical protein